MTESIREHLVGYLLDALEVDEQAMVEAALIADPRLREELELLRVRLQPLELAESHEPPRGLADRTCLTVALLAARPAPSTQHLSHAHSQEDDRSPPASPGLVSRTSHGEPDAPTRQPAESQRLLYDDADLPRARRSALDMAVAVALAITLVAMLSPAVLSSRTQARRAECENRLRQLGASLVSYSELSPDRRFPQIASQGRRAFAGVVTPLLHDRELLDDSSLLTCTEVSLTSPPPLVTLEQVDQAAGESLKRLQAAALGTMAYNLGVTVGGEYQAPRNQHRTQFVLMAEAPTIRQGLPVGQRHGGRGQNMLFEDGRTAYVVGSRVPGSTDDVFRNLEGRIEAGLTAYDSVVGASGIPPFAR